jgi:hypothetical protein
MATKGDLAEAAGTIRAVLALVESGELETSTPRAVATVRRLEGAATALETAAGSKG